MVQIGLNRPTKKIKKYKKKKSSRPGQNRQEQTKIFSELSWDIKSLVLISLDLFHNYFNIFEPVDLASHTLKMVISMICIILH